MSDVSKINLNGTVYNVKDSTARSSVAALEGKIIEVTYQSESETITFTVGGE